MFGSKRCDCREQLDLSLRYVQENGGGAVIYLAQEGRGIGLANKVAAYALQVCTGKCVVTPFGVTHIRLLYIGIDYYAQLLCTPAEYPGSRFSYSLARLLNKCGVVEVTCVPPALLA